MELSPGLSAIPLLGIGFLLGLQHAIEADHLAAVSAIVSEKKKLLSASLIGGLWGLGHTVSLFLAGCAVILLKMQIPESAENYLEGSVGIMLVLLGFNAMRKFFQAEKIHVHRHKHGTREHAHLHIHTSETNEQHHHISLRAILVGMIHGLAGSAALMLLILPAIPSPLLALFYILVFGLGSISGMMAMSFLIGLPLYLTANRFAFLHKGLRLTASLFSLGLGAVLINEKFFHN
ncbi:MAG: urease accessory protein [Acidobacteriota bacterium]|jgi:high-affinity nickel permease